MPTYQQRFGQRQAPPPSFRPPRRALPAPATQFERFKPTHAAGEGSQRSSDPQRAYRAMAQANILAKQGRHQEAQDVMRAAGVSPSTKTFDFKGALAATTGIDLNRIYHPIRALQQQHNSGNTDYAAYKRGDISAAELQRRAQANMQIGITPWGPTVGKLLGRIGGRAAEDVAPVAETFIPRPRTRIEAQRRLNYLDKKIDSIHTGLAGKYRGINAAEQGRRNVISGKAISGEGRGALKAQRAGVQPTLSGQFEHQTQQEIDAVVAKHAAEPWAKGYVAARDEANQLREALSAQHLPGEAPGPTPDLGQLTKREAAYGEQLRRGEVRAALNPARKTYAAQKAAISEQKGVRLAKATAAQEAAGGGIAGHQAFLGELRGEYVKPVFERLRQGNLAKGDVEQLVRDIQAHPELRPFEQTTASKALLEAFVNGKVPRPHEIKLLRTVFGSEAEAIAKASRLQRLGQGVIDAANVPRSILASFDVSAPLRQGITVLTGHPRIFGKSLAPMFKSLVSEPYYQHGVLDEIHARPNAPLYEAAGVRFTELRGLTSKAREEQFSSDLAEKIPGVGRVVRASGRAYTGFLDKARADVFDSMIEAAQKKGINTEDGKFLRSLGSYVNATTGRGGLGPVESWAPALNTIFFAPRLIASRVNFLNPLWYFKLDPFVRRQALKSVVTLGGGAALGLALAGEYTRATVGTNPLSADFAKLKLGNTRIDVLGGFQQYIRLAAQLQQGKIVSSTTGKEINLGHGFGKLSRLDVLQRFAQGKYSPPVSFVNDFFKGTTFAGQPFSLKQAVLSRIIPLVAQDALDLYHNGHSIPLAALGYGISATGVGIQTYSPRKPKSRGGGGGGRTPSNPYLGGSSSGSNPYLPGGGGSANPYLP